MKLALVIYAAFYVAATTITIILGYKSKEPLWDRMSDVVLLPLGFAGMILYGYGVGHPDLKSLWKIVAPAIVMGQVATNLFGRYFARKREPVQRDAVWFADIFSAVLLLPMFAINLAFAFK